jgi:hypothetical protein
VEISGEGSDGSTSICIPLIPSTMTLGLISPSLMGLGRRRPRRNRSIRASSVVKSGSEEEWYKVLFGGRYANELWMGVGIRLARVLDEWSGWKGPGERCMPLSVISKSSE